MAETFSLAVNVITLVDIAARILAVGSPYISSARGHAAQVRLLVQEIHTMSGVLTAVATMLQNNNDPTTDSAKLVALIVGPLQECTTQLSDLHSLLVKQVSGRNKWIRMGRQLKWPMKEKETIALIERIGRLQRSMSLALHAEDLGYRDKISTHLMEIRKEEEAARQERKAASEKQKRAEVLAWLWPQDEPEIHDPARRQQLLGSGKWFLDSAAFTTWKASLPSLLWLHGHQGAGKTILTSIVIDHLASTLQPNQQLAYFYCSPTTKPIHLYGSLITQLLRSTPSLPTEIVEHYDRNWNHRPYADDLRDMLLRRLAETGAQGKEVIVIIDGLEVCSEQPDLLSALSDIPTTAPCRLLVTSRIEEEIEYAFEAHPRVALQPHLVNEDVTRFVIKEVERRPTLKRLNANLKQEVVAAISCGTFGWGWAVESLDKVSCMRTDADVKKAIKRIKDSRISTQ